MQFRLKNNPKITDAIRESLRKNLTYLRTKSVLQNIPVGQYLSVKHRNGVWVRGTLLNFSKDRLLIQTPFSIKQIPITKMERITYREKIISMPEWKLTIYGLAALLGLGAMETWNRQTSPNWGYKWHNRFIGGIFGLVAGAEVYDTSMILLTKKTHFGLTPEELDKLNRQIIGGTLAEDTKEFKQAYLEEKLQAIADKLGDAYGEPFLAELISRMERTVAHFNEEVDTMLSSVKDNTKKRQKHFGAPEGGASTNQIDAKSESGIESNSDASNNNESEAPDDENNAKKKKFSLFKRKKKK